MNSKYKEFEKKAKYLRRLVLNMCVKAGTGHVTSSFSCVEILVALYYGGILKYKVDNPKWEDRDRFILSKGQASPILYAILGDLGFFSLSALDKFCCADGMFGVHLQNDVPGVEITTGSLGHGLGIGAGMAYIAKKENKNWFVFVLLGDGELYEGSVWESSLFASHHKLNNLIAIVDRNWLCVTDFTENIVKLEPIEKKWESYGWETKRIDGHNFKEIFDSFKNVKNRKSEKPLVIIANTIKGKGVSFMENQILWHGIAPKGKDAELARKELCDEK
ncbi:MAG: transketolase [Candidatus Omnitrophica bacterium]|nr:transketolase [Candidatus Omnitrophota bacterium]MCM8803475.1 transketolase [Candidatus Omnitrophota bacterium]